MAQNEAAVPYACVALACEHHRGCELGVLVRFRHDRRPSAARIGGIADLTISYFLPAPVRGPFLIGRFGPRNVSTSPALIPAPSKSFQPTLCNFSARICSALRAGLCRRFFFTTHYFDLDGSARTCTPANHLHNL